jgi:ABC-type sugar transport system ATPase subunit
MHIEIRGVTKSFGRTHALRDFDLSVPPASVIALVGENGVNGVGPRILTFL